jgi:hypothetical protein
VAYGNPENLKAIFFKMRDCNGNQIWERVISNTDKLHGETVAKDQLQKHIFEFERGPLSGRVRKIDLKTGGQWKTYYRASYNENGLLMREQIGEMTRLPNSDGGLTIYDGKGVPIKDYRIINGVIAVAERNKEIK